MIVEILGAKMLAPYVGTSHFVWTAQIAVTLVALATGYYVGGRLVDRKPRLERLYGAIFAAAIYLAGTVSLVEPLAYWCLGFRLALGSLLASALLFFVPLALLAMVGPFFVRVLTSAVHGVGGNVGRLTAVSTLGSFAGTLLIGYVLIPFLRNSVTMYVTTIALLAVATGYFAIWGRKKSAMTSAALALGAGLGLGALGVSRDKLVAGGSWSEISRANSNFGRLQVLDDRESGYRYYLNDFLPQDAIDTHTQQSIFSFTYMLHALARGYRTNIEDVLAIGLGVGIVPMQFAREGARVDVVEINPAIVPVAEKYFGLEPARLSLTIGDGRAFVNRNTKQYDALILDAFLGDSVPSHLMSRESFARMQAALRPSGVLVINSFGGDSPAESFITASLEKTLLATFRSVKLHTSGNGNVFLVASDAPELHLSGTPQAEKVHEHCRGQVEAAWSGEFHTDPDRGILLTDDYNPVEYYDAANREETRRLLALGVRRR